jgi:hypothetical protein
MKQINLKGGVGLIKKIAAVLFVMMLVLAPTLTLAADFQNPDIPVQGKALSLQEIEDFIKMAVQFLMVISLVIATGVIVYGGILYMVAGDTAGADKKAKAYIWNGIIGAAVVLAVGVILQTVASLITRSFFQ